MGNKAKEHTSVSFGLYFRVHVEYGKKNNRHKAVINLIDIANTRAVGASQHGSAKIIGRTLSFLKLSQSKDDANYMKPAITKVETNLTGLGEALEEHMTLDEIPNLLSFISQMYIVDQSVWLFEYITQQGKESIVDDIKRFRKGDSVEKLARSITSTKLNRRGNIDDNAMKRTVEFELDATEEDAIKEIKSFILNAPTDRRSTINAITSGIIHNEIDMNDILDLRHVHRNPTYRTETIIPTLFRYYSKLLKGDPSINQQKLTSLLGWFVMQLVGRFNLTYKEDTLELFKQSLEDLSMYASSNDTETIEDFKKILTNEEITEIYVFVTKLIDDPQHFVKVVKDGVLIEELNSSYVDSELFNKRSYVSTIVNVAMNAHAVQGINTSDLNELVLKYVAFDVKKTNEPILITLDLYDKDKKEFVKVKKAVYQCN